MTPTKHPLQSRTVWGLIVGAITGLLAVFDIDVPATEADQVVLAFATIFAFGFGLYGRMKARLGLSFADDPDPWNSSVHGLVAVPVLLVVLLTAPGCAISPHPTDDGLAHPTGSGKSLVIRGVAARALEVGLALVLANNPDARPWIIGAANTLDAAIGTGATAPEEVESRLSHWLSGGVDDPVIRDLLASEIDRSIAVYTDFVRANPEEFWRPEHRAFLESLAGSLRRVSEMGLGTAAGPGDPVFDLDVDVD